MPLEDGSSSSLYGLLREPCFTAFEIRFNERKVTGGMPANTIWETTLELRYVELAASLHPDDRLWSSMDDPGKFCVAPVDHFYILHGRFGAELMKRVPLERRMDTIRSRQYEMALAMKKGCKVGILLKEFDAGLRTVGNPLKELKFGTVESVQDGLVTVKHKTGPSIVSTSYNISKIREHPLSPVLPMPLELRNLLDDSAFTTKHDLHVGDRLVVFMHDYTVPGQLEWAGRPPTSGDLEVLIVTDEPVNSPHMLFCNYYQLVRADPNFVLRVPMAQAVKERHLEAHHEPVVHASPGGRGLKSGPHVSGQSLTSRSGSAVATVSPVRADLNHEDSGEALEVGSLVVGPGFRGVIRWIGTSVDEHQFYAGVETEEWQSQGGPAGEFEGRVRFSCEPGYTQFVPLRHLRRDNRFSEAEARVEVPVVPTKPPVESSDDDDDDDEEDGYQPQPPPPPPNPRQAQHSSPVISPHRVNAETNALHLYRSIAKPPIVSRDHLTNVMETVEQRDKKTIHAKSSDDWRGKKSGGSGFSPEAEIQVGRPPRALPRRSVERSVTQWREGDLVRMRHEARTIGHIRWIGESRDRLPMLGLELLSPDPRASAGVFEGELRFRPKSPKCCIFVRESDVIEAGDDDRLVAELAMLNGTPSAYNRSQPNQREFGHSPTPDLSGTVGPVSSSDLQRVIGRSRGIQGHCNSCYLDSILFSLFTFSSAMDSVLYRPPASDDIEQFSEVQKILKEGIVNPLRRRHFVRADKVMRLREMLGRLAHKDDMRYSQKDIEELFFILMERTLRVEPLIRLSSGEKTNMYQLFLESKEGLPAVPETQTLLELSLACSHVKFCEEPSVLLMLMPRHSADEQLFQKVIPSPELDLSFCVDGYPHTCFNCDRPAELECPQCIYDIGNVPSMEVAFQCRTCCKKCHAREREHRPEPYNISEDFRRVRQPTPLRLRLIAVICIRSQHYVSFVRCGSEASSPWVFFDSMAERIEGSHYLPSVQRVDVNQWLEAAQESMRNKRDRIRADLNLSGIINDPGQIDAAERLFGDGYMCVYHSLDAGLYR